MAWIIGEAGSGRLNPRRIRGCRAAIVAGALTVTACGSGTAAQAPAVAPTPVAVVVPHADRFEPYATAVTRDGGVTFHNADADVHTVTSVPGAPESFNLTVQPGATVALKLSKPGLYRYYCSLHARYDGDTGQVAALPGADHPNEPMAGVLTVSGS